MARADNKRVPCWEVDGHSNYQGYKGVYCTRCKDKDYCLQATMNKEQARHYFEDVVGYRSADWIGNQGSGGRDELGGD